MSLTHAVGDMSLRKIVQGALQSRHIPVSELDGLK
jgi:hypothetical protein